MTRALIDGSLANVEVVTREGVGASEAVHHLRPRSSHRTLCGHTCDDDGALGEWTLAADAHPEDASGMPGDVCSRCDASYRKARRVANGGQERRPDDRPAYKRGQPKPVPHVAASVKRSTPALDVFRMYRAELETLGTPEAMAELQRRRDKRIHRREQRKAAA